MKDNEIITGIRETRHAFAAKYGNDLTKSEKVRKALLFTFSLLLLTFATNEANACTGMYAGKGVTADGSVLIGQ